MKMSVLILNKEVILTKQNKELYKVTMTPIICEEFPVIVGKTLEKLVDVDFYASCQVNPLQPIELNVVIKPAFKPEYADLHLEVRMADDLD